MKNPGNVGIKNKIVYLKWLAILFSDTPSKYIQQTTKIVTNGKAANKPPNLSLNFPTSEIITINIAVVRIFVNVNIVILLRGFLLEGNTNQVPTRKFARS